MVTKGQAMAGGGVVVVGAAGATTGALIKSKQEDSLPIKEYTVLALDTGYSNDYSSTGDGSNFIGRRYGWYFVGTYGVTREDSAPPLNIEWWESSYEIWKNDHKYKNRTFSTEFGNSEGIKSGFADKGNNNDAGVKVMNKTCEKVYKKNFDAVDLQGTGSDDSKKKLAYDLLRYCSPMRQIPLSIRDSKEELTTGNWASQQERDFISVNNKKNNIFWKLRDDDFFGKTDEGTGSKASSALFKGLYSKKSQNERGSVKDVCKGVYLSKTISSDDQTDSLKFCTWKDSDS